MIKLYSVPQPSRVTSNMTTGIHQVVYHLSRHLPNEGFEYVESQEDADLVISHAGDSDGNADVTHCHGFYPNGDPGFPASNQIAEINRRVIHDIINAYQVTVTAEWVADIVRRHMHFDPRVVPWGVDAPSWAAQQPTSKYEHGYVLWNKARNTDVCDDAPVSRLSQMMPNVPFLSTFGKERKNTTITGPLAYDEMREIVKGAGIYLATTKETFGIATLEAMAAGVPVVGWNWGATPDIVEHGVSGILVAPYDYEATCNAIQYVYEHLEGMSRSAIKRAKKFTWQRAAKQIAEIYRRAYEEKKRPKTVSVIIPHFNYGHYLPHAVNSAVTQQTNFSFDVTIVDDCSTDKDSLAVIEAYENMENPRVSVMRLDKNHGIANLRNKAIAASTGDYIVLLDADDALSPGYLQACYNLMRGPGTGAVTTHLKIMGRNTINNFPSLNGFNNFNAILEKGGGGAGLHTASMFSRRAWQRVGGHRKRYTPADDGRFWLDIMELGFSTAMVEDQSVFLHYRLHNQSLTSQLRSGKRKEPDWKDKVYREFDSMRPIAAPPKARYARRLQPEHISPPLKSIDDPVFSVIIPVGPYHLNNVMDALDSIKNQTTHRWECILVMDCDAPPPLGVPWARVLRTPSPGSGPSVARNLGIDAAHGDFVVFLDADDTLAKSALQDMLVKYMEVGRYVYPDFNMITKAGEVERHVTPAFEPHTIFKSGYFHPVTALVPTEWAQQVRFDEEMTSWEDWDFYARLIIAGYCGVRIAKPLLTYNYNSGKLRESGFAMADDIKARMRVKYREYIVEGKEIVCNCGGKKKKVTQAPLESSELVYVEFHGRIPPEVNPTPQKGRVPVKGLATGRNYGRKQGGDRFQVHKRDAEIDSRFKPVEGFQANYRPSPKAPPMPE